MLKNLFTVFFIALFVLIGAIPYRQSNFALSHQPTSLFVMSKNSFPSNMPRSG